MAYEFIKKLFGEPKEGEQPKAMTYAELEAALDADKTIKVIDLNAGGYVSKDKFDAKDTELKGVRQQLTDANTTIQSYKDMDIEGVKQSAKDWETKYNTDTQALKDQIAAQARSHAEDMFMSGYQFTSKAARNGVLADFRAKKFTLDENGVFQGGKEYMESLMKQDDYKGAFVSEEKEPETPPDQQNQNQQQNGRFGQQPPRFAAGTNGGATPPEGNANPFLSNLGVTRLHQPKQNQ